MCLLPARENIGRIYRVCNRDRRDRFIAVRRVSAREWNHFKPCESMFSMGIEGSESVRGELGNTGNIK